MRAKHTIGREADNDIVIARPSISARHATISWATSGWVLKDTSTHGTLVNGALIKGGAATLLQTGDTITFVEADEVWTLESTAPPGLLLARVDGQGAPLHVDHDHGLLALPSEAVPEHTLLQEGDAWILESEAGVRRRLIDGAEVELLGVSYRVSVPPPLRPTADPENPASPFSLAVAHVELSVHRGEDEAALTIRCGGAERVVKASRPLYLLAYLAEHRKRSDADDGGWIPTELACSELHVDRTALNVDVHRIRESVKATGLIDGANIVERRPGQIRIATPSSRCRVLRN